MDENIIARREPTDKDLEYLNYPYQCWIHKVGFDIKSVHVLFYKYDIENKCYMPNKFEWKKMIAIEDK